MGGFEPPPVRRRAVEELIAAVRADTALVLTSFHQSPLPTALLLRLAGVTRIAADSEDYPGSLLDVRHHRAPHAHEVDAALDLAEAAGFPRPADTRLRILPRPTPAPSPAPAPTSSCTPGRASRPAAGAPPAAPRPCAHSPTPDTAWW